MSEKLAKFLNDKRIELSKEEGRRYDLLTWRELAKRANLPETNLARWKSGLGVPGLRHIQQLSKVFGEDIYDAADLPTPLPNDLTPTMRYIIRHRNDPFIREEIERIYKKFNG